MVNQDIKPIDACAEPIAGVASRVKMIMTIVLVIAGVIAVVNPILKGMGLMSMPEISGTEASGQTRLF